MAKKWDPIAKKWVDAPNAGFDWATTFNPTAIAATQDVENVTTAGGDNEGDPWAGVFGGGGGGGPTRQQSRDWGFAAARGLERTGRQAQAAMQQRANEQAAAMQGFYNPAFDAQQAAVEQQRQAAMNYLQQQYGGNEQTIQQATQAALQNLPQYQSYSNVPLVELSAQQNPLLASLGAYGAGTEAVTAQQQQDAALANQLAQLTRGAAGQLNTAQQNMRQAAMGDINTRQAEALRQLALNRFGVESGIAGTAQQALAELAGQRATAGADIEAMRQEMLNKSLEQMLGGQSDAASMRAKVISEFGPRPKKPKANKPQAPKPKATPKTTPKTVAKSGRKGMK